MKLALLIAPILLLAPLWADDNNNGNGNDNGNGNSSGNFKASLTGYDEVLPVWTQGSGDVTVSVDTTAAKITVTIAYSNLSSAPVAAHLHWGNVGVSGPIILTLCGSGSANTCPANGAAATTLTYTAQALQSVTPPSGLTGSFPAANLNAFAQALGAGVIYANVHTQQLPNGEIRGQVGHGNSASHGRGPKR